MADDRIIDLDLDNPKLPEFFKDLERPINMTLCAGDGIQEGITDIEWYVTKKKGYSREKKDTTIFITTKNYNRKGLEENKKYLKENTDLKVILLIYDDTKPKWKKNLIKLLPNSIDNIYEDFACYGEILDLATLYGILRENGIYHISHSFNAVPSTGTNHSINSFIERLPNYIGYLNYFTIDLEDMPCKSKEHGEMTRCYKIIKDNKNQLLLPNKEYNKVIEDIITINKLFEESKRIELDKEDSIKRQLWKNSKKGGKKKKTKKSKKTRKNKTRKAKNRRKHYTFSHLKRPL